MKNAVLVFLILFSFKVSACADTLYLNNGRTIEGIIQKEDEQSINLEVNCGMIKFTKDQIKSISRSSEGTAQSLRQVWAEEKEIHEAKVREAREKAEHEPKLAVMNKESGHMMVSATLNKKVKVNLILDTGASILALSSKVAVSLGVDTSTPPKPADTIDVILADGSKVGARRIILDSVSVQGSEVEKVEAAILPKQATGLIAGDGLLGMSFLKKFSFKIDQKNDQLILEKL